MMKKKRRDKTEEVKERGDEDEGESDRNASRKPNLESGTTAHSDNPEPAAAKSSTEPMQSDNLFEQMAPATKEEIERQMKRSIWI